MAAKTLTNIFKRGKDAVRLAISKYQPQQTVEVGQPGADLFHLQPSRVVAPIRTLLFRNRISYKTIASQLRRRAAFEFGRKNPIPIFAFVGLVLANKQEDENEILSSDIRELLQSKISTSPIIRQLSLQSFEFGNVIGKGCNAVVYEARLKGSVERETILDDHISSDFEEFMSAKTQVTNEEEEKDIETEDDKWYPPEESYQGETTEKHADDNKKGEITDTVSMNSVSDEEDSESFCMIKDYEEESTRSFTLLDSIEGENRESFSVIKDYEEESTKSFSLLDNVEGEVTHCDSDNDLGIFLDFSSLSLVESDADSCDTETTNEESETEEECDKWSFVGEEMNTEESKENETDIIYDFAVKMMFNYEVESKADSIRKAMEKETVPARIPIYQIDDCWFIGNKVRLKSLPQHINIVDMVGAFVDPFDVPQMSVAMETYPAALPKRLYSRGLGRNMTMYIVMKKYNLTLRQYLEENNPDVQTRCLLLTQLLEGVVHLRNHGIAHRDIKSDNLFLDLTVPTAPQLVIGDFGCCLADTEFGQRLPYFTADVDRGGNCSLMAPEISTACPGRDVWLDFSKTDLWAVGTIIYELFSRENPFYGNQSGQHTLDSRTYRECDLPSLPDEVPEVVRLLARMCLSRDPLQRPSPVDAANMMQIYHWFPAWFNTKPTVSVVKDSLLILTARLILLRQPLDKLCQTDRLMWTFLHRININDLMKMIG